MPCPVGAMWLAPGPPGGRWPSGPDPEYQRCGLAAAGLAALRAEYPGLDWHTLGGHFRESEPFWLAAGAGAPGGYRKRGMCPHRGQG